MNMNRQLFNLFEVIKATGHQNISSEFRRKTLTASFTSMQS